MCLCLHPKNSAMLRGGLRLRSLMESLEVLNCFKFTPEEREREREREMVRVQKTIGVHLNKYCSTNPLRISFCVFSFYRFLLFAHVPSFIT